MGTLLNQGLCEIFQFKFRFQFFRVTSGLKPEFTLQSEVFFCQSEKSAHALVLIGENVLAAARSGRPAAVKRR
jgi:hypothetical protein